MICVADCVCDQFFLLLLTSAVYQPARGVDRLRIFADGFIEIFVSSFAVFQTVETSFVCSMA